MTRALLRIANQCVSCILAHRRRRVSKSVILIAVVSTNLIIFETPCFPRKGLNATDYKSQDELSKQLYQESTSLAFHQSYQFFEDIPDSSWVRFYQQPALTALHYRNSSDPNDRSNDTAYWLFFNWERYFNCPRLRKIGKSLRGARWTCDPCRLQQLAARRRQDRAAVVLPREKGKKRIDFDDSFDCLIYSFGFAHGLSWEMGMMEISGPICEFHLFDPMFPRDTPQELHNRRNVIFHPWEPVSSELTAHITTKDSLAFTFKEIQQKLAHVNRTIDILKVDCDGCEWYTYKDWVSADIRQLLITTNDLPVTDHLKKESYGNVLPMKGSDFFDQMKTNGLVLFSKEIDSAWGRAKLVNWSFIKLHPAFFVSNVTNRKTT